MRLSMGGFYWTHDSSRYSQIRDLYSKTILTKEIVCAAEDELRGGGAEIQRKDFCGVEDHFLFGLELRLDGTGRDIRLYHRFRASPFLPFYGVFCCSRLQSYGLWAKI